MRTRTGPKPCNELAWAYRAAPEALRDVEAALSLWWFMAKKYRSFLHRLPNAVSWAILTTMLRRSARTPSGPESRSALTFRRRRAALATTGKFYSLPSWNTRSKSPMTAWLTIGSSAGDSFVPRASEHVDGYGIARTSLEQGGAEVLGAESELAGPKERDRKRGFRHAVDHPHCRAAEDPAID
jgi:hypothetical protein